MINPFFCDKCKDLVASRSKIVAGYGNLDAKIFFVGLAPGRNGADVTGVPFTKDPSGVLLQESLIKSGFSVESDPKNEFPKLLDVYITNIVKCNPKDDKGNNRSPSDEEIKNCIPYLKREITNINPTIVVLFGKIVTQYILDIRIKKFLDFHNSLIKLENRQYIPFIHPSYVIRGAYNRNQFIEEINQLKRFIHKR